VIASALEGHEHEYAPSTAADIPESRDERVALLSCGKLRRRKQRIGISYIVLLKELGQAEIRYVFSSLCDRHVRVRLEFGPVS
jgi:predicted subunit of tRNA(5-methylaminomethyl-2-thiouridylate) methyltransferase